MLVEEIMSRDIVYVSPEDSVSKLISLIEKHCLREILVTDNKKLKGIVYSKDIAKKGIIDPSKNKVSNLMRFPPHTLSPDQDVNEAAKSIFKTGLRALPVVEKNKVVGIVSLHDIVDMATKTKKFRQTNAESIMILPEVTTGDTDIGAARMLMREKNISRIPIVDKNQKLSGVITIFDLLRAVKPRERMSFYSMAAEKETTMGIPISTVMKDTPTKVSRKTSLSEIVSLMRKDETDGVIVTENDFPVGIITEKDLLEVYISSLEQKGIYYQIVGLVDEDEFIVATVDRMIRDTLQKLSKMYNVQSFFLHVKRYDKTGKIKYSIRTRLLTDKGMFVSKSHEWDLRSAVDRSLEHLQRITIKKKQLKNDKNKEMLRFKKLNE